MIDKISWIAVYPEIVLLTMACVIALVDLGVNTPRRTATYLLTMLTLAVVAAMQAAYAVGGDERFGFGNMVVSDQMGNWLKCFATLAVMVTLVYGRPYAAERQMLQRGGELFSMSMLALLGMFVMIGGNNFLVIYLGLELLTLSSYALVALRRDHATSTEAAMKYFVLGALASGFLLYGMSMMYGATGSLDINTVFKAISSGQVKHQVLVFGLVFVVAGLAFKLGVVPFHMWIPDVYQGAPTAVTLLIGGAPKLAAFAIVIRLLVEGMLPLAPDWQQMLMVLSIGSLLIGNLAAIAQTNLKRMLAFSTISQMGFVLLGLMAGVVNGNVYSAANAYSSAMFYVVTYVLTTLATFGVIMLLAREGFESEEIADFAGLNQRSPWYALAMLMVMASQAGVPVWVGFFAKFQVLKAALQTPGMLWLALAGAVFTVIGAFYYLRVIKVMYFDEPKSADRLVLPADMPFRFVLSLNGLALLGLGLFGGPLMALCLQAVSR